MITYNFPRGGVTNQREFDVLCMSLSTFYNKRLNYTKTTEQQDKTHTQARQHTHNNTKTQ